VPSKQEKSLLWAYSLTSTTQCQHGHKKMMNKYGNGINKKFQITEVPII